MVSPCSIISRGTTSINSITDRRPSEDRLEILKIDSAMRSGKARTARTRRSVLANGRRINGIHSLIIHFAEGKFLTAETAPIQESRGAEEEAFKLSRAVLEKLRAYRNIDGLSSPYAGFSRIWEPSRLADAIAPYLSAENDKKQELLEARDVVTRLEKILALMNPNQRPAKLTAEP
jgi:ATP-dependent Lon protease